jgi:aldehyde:ferredoxin oxidoreductase
MAAVRGDSGRWGRIVTVDLTTGQGEVERPSDEEWRRYVGGGLMGVRHLLQHTPAGLDPYDPQARILYMSSAVTGHPYVGLARFTVVAKSPLTGGVGEGRASGPFGLALKASGLDGLVVHGRASVASHLVVENGQVRVVASPELWGTDVGEVTDRLAARYGENSCVCAIGRSGERLVRFASVTSERTFPVGRMGLGAVMGAKLLKAVVVLPGRAPEPAAPDVLRELTAAYSARSPHNVLTTEQAVAPGFGAWPLGGDPTGRVGVANFTSSAPPALGFSSWDLESRLVQDRGSCPGCPANCVKTFHNRVDPRAGGLDEEFLAGFALGLGIDDLDALLDLNARCHEWGVDPVSLAGVLAFVLEAAGRGLLEDMLPRSSVPGFGQVAGWLDVAEAVALRRPGFEWLGEGVARAAALLPRGATELAMHIKGLELTAFEPRTSAGLALAWAVSPLGPRYEIVEHDVDVDPVDGYPHGLDMMATLGTLTWEPMEVLDSSRVVRTARLLDLWSGLDALGFCLFAGPPMRVLSMRDVTSVVSAVTGWEASDLELLLWGRRRLVLMRLYNLREGIDAEQDRLPDRFFDEPVGAGRHRGAVLDRVQFAEAIQEYYELVGWDHSGRPRPVQLASLGLGWAAAAARSGPASETSEKEIA